MQLSLISGKQMCEPLAVKHELYIRGNFTCSTLPLTAALSVWGQWVHVGCASTGSSTHPVPPSALVPGRKYHHDPTPIRTRSWTVATTWCQTIEALYFSVFMYAQEGERKTDRDGKIKRKRFPVFSKCKVIVMQFGNPVLYCNVNVYLWRLLICFLAKS